MKALKVFAESLLVMLKDFLTSKKVLTAVLTAVAGAVFKDPAVRDRVVAAGLLLLAGFAAADHGATAAKIGAASAAPPPPAAAVRTALAPLVPQGAPPLVPTDARLQGTSPGGTT